MVRRKLYDWTIVLETVAWRVVYVLSSTHVMHMRRGLLCYPQEESLRKLY